VSSDKSLIDKALVGDWVDVPLSDGNEWNVGRPRHLRVMTFNEREYVAVLQESGAEASLLQVYTTEVEGVNVAVCRGLNESIFMFFRYTIDEGKRLTLRALDSSLFEGQSFNTPEEQRDFVARNIGREDLYMDPITFERNRYLFMQLRSLIDD